MDNDQLIKRVEWLDKERLEDKATISDLVERIQSIEGDLKVSNKHFEELDSQITRLNVVVEKVDKFEATLSNFSVNFKNELDSYEKKQEKREKETIKKNQKEAEAINKNLAEFKNGLLSIDKFGKEIKSQTTEHNRLAKSLKELSESVEEIKNSENKLKEIHNSLSEEHKKDAARIANLQGEVAAFRKRLDGFGGKMELALSDQQKNNSRLNEIQAAEIERRDSQTAFKEEITKNLEEQESVWKKWGNRFDIIETQSDDLAKHLRNISDTELSVKKAQEKFEEITDQISRRINEITEMQRLGEEKFRQDFTNFKADDQKRWTSYTLTQQEVQNEFNRIIDRLSGETANLEDTIHGIQDVLTHLSNQTEKLLETTLKNMKEWVAENKKFHGSTR
ncbi:MAG: hypothetical protein N2C13_05170 [Chloroflexota bacterium]